MKSQRVAEVVIGIGRLFDFSGSYNLRLEKKYLRTDSRRLDQKALKGDWIKVGKSLKSAMEQCDLPKSNSIRHNHV